MTTLAWIVGIPLGIVLVYCLACAALFNTRTRDVRTEIVDRIGAHIGEDDWDWRLAELNAVPYELQMLLYAGRWPKHLPDPGRESRYVDHLHSHAVIPGYVVWVFALTAMAGLAAAVIATWLVTR